MPRITGIRSRMKLFDSFFGLTHRFKVMIISEVPTSLTNPLWFSIYLKKDLEASDEGIGLVNAVQSAVGLILQPLGGVIGQKYSKKGLYLLGLAIRAFAFVIAFLAIDWTWAIYLSAVLGCYSLVGPGISALVGEVTDRATRAAVFALESTIMSVVEIIRGPMQGFIAEALGLRYLYLSATLGVMISFIIISRLFPDAKREGGKGATQNTGGGCEAKPRANWREQIRQVFARPDYRRNFIGLLQAGVLWRLFSLGFSPFIDIYLYEEIGWSFIFFGFYQFISSLAAMIVKIPFGKLIDKYHLRRVFFFIAYLPTGIMYLLMVYVRDPYLLAAIFLVESTVGVGNVLAIRALWYDAIPLDVYPMGSAISGVIYGCTAIIGSLLGAYLWTNLGPFSCFYIAFATETAGGFVGFYLIRDIKGEE